jgi:tRNA-splicing ligase RtcB (3'-phosphate/5'-hydroxy nucleic acid ligase)
MNLKIFAEGVEQSALDQVNALSEHPAFKDQKIRIMPDVHVGAGCVIGFTSTFADKVVPQIVGVDIGCGVDAVCLRTYEGELDNPGFFGMVDDRVRRNIPSGFNVHSEFPSRYGPNWWAENPILMSKVMDVCGRIGLDTDRVFKSIGTLGGGNHFLELNLDELWRLWAVVHSGSRNFGLRVAKYHQDIANKKNPIGMMSYLDGDDAKAYIEDMKVAQEYAALNRKALLWAFSIGLYIRDGKPMILEEVSSVHNHINFDDGIIRKGAISAHAGEKVIIPFNMRDGSIIAEGLGNDDWNYSAPHGAGRIMGRNAAKRSLSVNEFKETMAGVWSSCMSEKTLDESPMAYKNKDVVLSMLSGTVKVLHTLKPIYNFKASE